MMRFLNDRNFLLITAILLGLLWDGAVQWTDSLVFPALVLIMTLAIMGIRRDAFGSIKSLFVHGGAGVMMTYAVHGTFLLALSSLLMHDLALWSGFVILAAVPPAVAVVPFSVLLNGNASLSLMGTVGAYLGALIIAPLISFIFLGADFISPVKVLTLVAELIIMPVILANFLTWIKLSGILDPVKGKITNWSFFLITYTIVGLNREVFTNEPLTLLPVVFIAFAGTFVLGELIRIVAKKLRLQKDITISIVLLGTFKNYGLSGGIALSLFDQRAAIPSTVSIIFMILYIIWLEYRKKHVDLTVA